MSRVLDALVAERVLNRRAWAETRGEYELAVLDIDGREPWSRTRNPDVDRYREITCVEAARMGFFGRSFPPYSADIAAAWTVVEAMRAKHGQNEGFEFGVDISKDFGWSALLVTGKPGGAVETENEATAPLAICLTALRSVGVPEAEIRAALEES